MNKSEHLEMFFSETISEIPETISPRHLRAAEWDWVQRQTERESREYNEREENIGN